MSAPSSRAAFSGDDSRRMEEVERLSRGRRIDGLVAMLDDPSWPVRRAVVGALGAAGPAAVGPLCAALRHQRSSEGRVAATVDALATIACDADAALAAMADSAEPPVLADIAQILGRRRTVSALSTVVALSRHADDNVAVAAIEALGRIGGRTAIDSLVEAVRSASFFRAFPAIDVLGRSGDPRAVAPLAQLLEQPVYTAEAARALGRTGDAAAVAPLMALVARSSNVTLVRLVAVALAELHERYGERVGNSQAVNAGIKNDPAGAGLTRQLIRALADGDTNERTAICFLLGVLGGPLAGPPLTGLLDGPPPVAQAAAAAMKALGPSVEEDVLQSIRGGGSSQRRALLPFISSAAGSPEATACLADEDPDVRVLACEALGRIGAVASAAALFPLLADPDPRVTYAAIAAIQSLGSVETERRAIAAAGSSDVRVRRAAMRILAYFGTPAALDVFLTALNDPDERVRESAVQGLPMMDDPRAFEALLTAARDDAERTRAAAMRSLGQCVGDLRASAYLLKGLADPDGWVRYYACQALGKMAFEPAADAIVRLLADGVGQVRVAAVEALSCLRGERAVKALETAAGDDDGDIRRAAILGLGVARRQEALPLILEAARAPDTATRLVALSALASFRSPEVVEAFRRAAVDTDESVRTAAIGFLAAMTGSTATRVLAELLRVQAPEPVLAALSLHVDGRIPGLAGALEGADEQLAPPIASALTRLRRPDATAVLIAAMDLPNVAARKAAASALAVISGKDALAVLARAAREDPELEVRQICSLLLAR